MSPDNPKNSRLLQAIIVLLCINLVTAIGVGFVADSSGDTAADGRDLVASVVNPESQKAQNLQLVCFLQAVRIERALQFNESLEELQQYGIKPLVLEDMDERCMVFEFAQNTQELKENGLPTG